MPWFHPKGCGAGGTEYISAGLVHVVTSVHDAFVSKKDMAAQVTVVGDTKKDLLNGNG